MVKTMIQIQVPELLRATLEAAGYYDETLRNESQRALAALLYARGVLSLGQAAKLARLPLRDFIHYLGSLQIPAIQYPPSELAHDLESIKWQMSRK